MVDQEINETNTEIYIYMIRKARRDKWGKNEGKKFIGVCICQNASNYTLQRGSYYNKLILNKKYCIVNGRLNIYFF